MLKRLWNWLVAHSRQFLVGSLGFLCLCGLLYGATLSSSNRQCQSDRATRCAKYENPDFFEKSGTFFVCEGATIDANGELLTAIATIVMAIFTGTLWFVTNKSLNLARDEFNSTFRPHLTVRNVHALDAGPDDEMEIAFELINNGSSKATIVASDFEVNFVGRTETFRNLHLPKVGEPPKNFLGKRDLIPSQVYRGTFKPGRKWQTHHFDDSRSPENGFFWGGKILYQDATGKQRRLGVYRRFDISSRRFRPVGDSEFEYDD